MKTALGMWSSYLRLCFPGDRNEYVEELSGELLNEKLTVSIFNATFEEKTEDLFATFVTLLYCPVSSICVMYTVCHVAILNKHLNCFLYY